MRMQETFFTFFEEWPKWTSAQRGRALHCTAVEHYVRDRTRQASSGRVCPDPERRNSRGKEVLSPSPPISAGKEVSSPLQQTSPSPTPPLSCASESDKTRPGGALFKTANKASNRADGAPMIPRVLSLQDVETILHPIRKDVRSPGKCPILPHPSDKYTDWLTLGFDLAI